MFYSNYGTNELSLVAPGGGSETFEETRSTDTEWPFPPNRVLSTTPPDVFGGAYGYFAGTSMAAPQVPGTAALVAATNPKLNAEQTESVVENGTKRATGQQTDDTGAGVLDAAGAVEEASRGREGKDDGKG